MQICPSCGAKNIDGLDLCWRCRQPVGANAGDAAYVAPTAPYRRARGIRPAVGIAMLLRGCRVIGAWLWLRAPDPVALPASLGGERAVLEEESRGQERRVAELLDIASGYAFYGPSADRVRFGLVVFQDLRPPYTPTFLVNHYQGYIQRQGPFVESEQLLERRADGVVYTCHRVPRPEGILGQAIGEPYLWCAWHDGVDELGIVFDLSDRSVRRTLELTKDARAAVASL